MFADALRTMLNSAREIAVVGATTNGMEALRLARKLRPDVAVLELGLRGLNGIDVAQHLIEHQPPIRVLMLSMHSSPEFIHRAFSVGASGYVFKEASGTELIEAIRTVHRGKRHLPRQLTLDGGDAFLRRNSHTGPLASLTARERHVLQLVVEGHSSAKAAKAMSLSPKTVDSYRSRIKHKLGIHDLPGLVKFAIQHGLTPLG